MNFYPIARSSINQTQTLRETSDRTSYSVAKVVNLINRISNIAFAGAVIFSAGKEVFFYNKEMSKCVFDHQISLASGGWGVNDERNFLLNIAAMRFFIDLVYTGSAYLGVRAINNIVIKLNDCLVRLTDESRSVKKKELVENV